MTKEFCDLCLKEIRVPKYKIRVHYFFKDKTMCIKCFDKKSNWSFLHTVIDKEIQVELL